MSVPPSQEQRAGRRADQRATTLLALLLPVFAWAPLAYPGYFVLHSGFLPIFNLNDLMRHLADPAWAPIVGQPHDLWRGERAAPYLLAAAPHLLGVTSVTAVKMVLALSVIAGSLGIYAWARRSIGAWPALLAALVYVLWPVNLAALYVRGAFAEVVFLGLMPWVLWAAERAARSRRLWPALLLALLMAVTFWTQAGLAAWLSAITLAYLLIMAHGAGHRPWAALAGWLGGWLLGLVGLAPVILRNGASATARVPFADHFVYPHQLLWPGAGLGPSITGPDDTLTFQLGIVAFGLALFALVDPARRADDAANRLKPLLQPDDRLSVIFAAAVVLLLAFLSSTLSAPVWRILPAPTLTYPWQLLLLAGPWVAWLAGLGGLRLAELWQRSASADTRSTNSVLPLYAGLMALALLGSYAVLSPQATPATPPDAPVALFGADELALLRARVIGAPGPGKTLTLETEWQSLRPVDQDYTIFFHAIGPEGVKWGQADSMPQNNAAPTSGWQLGQVMTDTLKLSLPADAPAGGDYTYLMGLYLWQTGARLPTGADDQVMVQP